mmetsp:Transcript_23066/g.55849  ORF Transcript_23066/g.55849 Transcript_23066/m.55849 type:complete len:495 (+) Transcript_23066:155-1639(+)
MSVEHPPSLAAFFVFNPTLGEEETEGRKNLFFYPDTDSNSQKDYIGLTEGIINFTRDFSPDKPCEALRCEKTRHSFYECEPDFWMVLIMNNPYVFKGRNSTQPVYLEDELGDSTLQAIVKRTYATFRMFNGSMANIAKKESMESLKVRLRKFMLSFIPTIDFARVGLSLDIRGFSFMPVNRNSFLTTQFIVNTVMTSFPHVCSCGMMYDRKLIWSGLDQEDMFFLYLLDQKNMASFYDYVYSDSNAPHKEERKNSKISGSKLEDSILTQKKVGFIVKEGSRATPVFLQTYGWMQKRLAIFRFYKITFFMVLEDVAESSNKEVYDEMEAMIKPELEKLDTALVRQGQQDSKASDSYRFLYFNALNLALVSTVTEESGMTIAPETIKLIRKIHKDFQVNAWKGYDQLKQKDETKKSEGTNEKKTSVSKTDTIGTTIGTPIHVAVKTKSDGWLVGSKASQTQREFFVLVDHKNANLTTIQEEVNRLARSYFAKIFMH